jgi:ketosteroid isomerase-like protein
VELVRRGIEDVEVFWAMLDEYVVWDMRALSVLDLDPVIVGRDAVIESWRHYWGTWEEYRLDADEVIDAGASVVIVVRERMRGKGSGVPIDRRWAQIWNFHRGRIIRWETFPDKAAALEAAGLRE